jgi:hypothetical protein
MRCKTKCLTSGRDRKSRCHPRSISRLSSGWFLDVTTPSNVRLSIASSQVQLPTSNLVHNNETENGFADQSRDAADSRERAGLRGWGWNTPAFFHNYEKKSDRVRSRRSSRLANFGLPYRMDSIFLSRDMSHDQSATNLRGAELIGGQSQTQQEHGRVKLS